MTKEELLLEIFELKGKLRQTIEERDSYKKRLETLKEWLYEAFVPQGAKLVVILPDETHQIFRPSLRKRKGE